MQRALGLVLAVSVACNAVALTERIPGQGVLLELDASLGAATTMAAAAAAHPFHHKPRSDAAHAHNAHGKTGKVRHSPLSIPLVKSEPLEQHRTDVLLSLKMRQRAKPVLLEVGARDVPLKKEVLKEKKLVTYYAELGVGGNPFRILLDTGSCEFWIPSSGCTTSRCEKHRRFPLTPAPGQSQRFRYDNTASMSIEYLSGKVEGPFIYDDVTLGDVTVKDQVVGVANTVDIVLLDDVVWDGILGLAYPTPALLEKSVSPFFDTLMTQKLLTSQGLANQFAYYINDDAGSITLGGANCDLIVPAGGTEADCISRFSFIPVTEKTYWTVTLSDVRVKWPDKPEMSGFCPVEGCKTIIDTGTYLIYGPETQVHTMLSDTIEGCGDYTKMPDLMFDFKTSSGQESGPPVTLTLRPMDYILKFKMDDRDDCVVGVSPDKDTIWTLGQVFLRSFYTIFDRDVDRVGFAPLNREKFTSIKSSPEDFLETQADMTETFFR